MARTLFLAAWFLGCSVAQSASAGQSYEAIDAGDIIVATVKRVDGDGATNGRPPRVWLEVHEVLRGEAKLKRSPAVWEPRFHGVDWSGDDAEKLITKWKAAPLKGPKVGHKFILGGRALEPERPGATSYALFEFVHIPYTEKARRDVLAFLKARDDAAKAYQQQQKAAARERDLRRTRWRQQFSDATIDRLTQRADAVAIGTISGGTTFKIERLLKGRARMTSGDTYYVTLAAKGFDERIADLVIDGRPRSVLFLSEEGLVASVTDAHAKLIDPYVGLVIADDAVIRAVEASLAKTPPPAPRPVLVISALDRSLESELATAFRDRFDVVLSHQFSAHGEHAVKHVREHIPAARYLVMIDRGPPYHVVAVRIDEDKGITLYTGQWEEKQLADGIEVIRKTLPPS